METDESSQSNIIKIWNSWSPEKKLKYSRIYLKRRSKLPIRTVCPFPPYTQDKSLIYSQLWNYGFFQARWGSIFRYWCCCLAPVHPPKFTWVSTDGRSFVTRDKDEKRAKKVAADSIMGKVLIALSNANLLDPEMMFSEGKLLPHLPSIDLVSW